MGAKWRVSSVMKPFLAVVLMALLLTQLSAADHSNQGHCRQFAPGQLKSVSDIPTGRFRSQMEKLPEAVRKRAMDKLKKLHLTEHDFEDLHVGNAGGIAYACMHRPTKPADAEAAEIKAPETTTEPETTSAMAAAVPSTSLPSSLIFHSRPGSSNIVYLNFLGETVSGTAWNIQYGLADPWEAKPFSKDSDLNTFSDLEQTWIKFIWRRVAEDYAPFDIDVTTERPATFTNTTGMILFTDVEDENGNLHPFHQAGGVAKADTFGKSNYASYESPCFVFDDAYFDVGDMANSAAHEFGHNLALTHDGSSAGAYYAGHSGSGVPSWGAIMGTGYTKSVIQFSKGEYYDANNSQDDLAIIAGKLGYRPDDHGDIIGAATELSIGSGGSISVLSVFDDPTGSGGNKGVIEKDSDIDVFSFVSGVGGITLNVNPDATGGTNSSDLDLKIKLYDKDGTEVASNRSDASVSASISYSVPTEDVYYLEIQNEGVGSPLSNPPTGYTSYGSIGKYLISGSIVEPLNYVYPPSATLTVGNISQEGISTHTFTVKYTDNVKVDVSTLDSSDILVTGPNGFSETATFESVDTNTDGTPRTATYSVTPAAGGDWLIDHNGTYTISIVADEVGDTEGAFVTAKDLGSFDVNVPAAVVDSDNLDTNAGWTLTPDWEYGAPNYTGNPSSAATGTNIVGYNLSGDYGRSQAVVYAISPNFDCSTCTSAKLRFKRWLVCYSGDTCTLEVSVDGSTWASVWSGSGVFDSSWETVEYDLPSLVVAEKSTVQFRFGLSSNNKDQAIGWNIDDLEILKTGTVMTGTIRFSTDAYTVDENGTSATITVKRAGGTKGAVSVNYATSNGTATAGSDYTAKSGSFSWADGNADDKTFTVAITNDSTYEGDETINLNLSNVSGTTISGANPATLTIVEDDEGPGTVEFSSGSYTVAEDGTDVTITVSRVDGAVGAISVEYATSDGTATAGSDYTAASGTLNWGNGDSADKTFVVSMIDDSDTEGDETISLTLSNPSGTTISGSNTGTLTITDDEFDPNLRLHWKLDETSGTTAADSSGNGWDGTLGSGPVWTTAGKIDGALSFDGVRASAFYAMTETTYSSFTVAFWAKNAASVQDAYASAFNNNSNGSDFQIDLGNGYQYRGGATGSFGSAPVDQWVHLAVVCSGTATTLYYNGAFVRTLSCADTRFGRIAIGVNRNSTQYFKGAVDDLRVYDRALNATEVTDLFDAGSGPVAGTVEFSATSYTVAENGTSVDITVSRVGGSDGAVSVDYATSDDTATAGSDYTAASGTLSWADGDSADKTFTVSITDNSTYEGDEAVTLTLSNPSGTTISSTNPVTLTITEDDTPVAGTVEFSATSYSVAENGTSVDITVSRVGGSDGVISVDYATSNDTATAGSDYTAASGTLTWADGDSADKTFTVTITDDTTYEGDEDITLTLSNASGTTISSTNPVTLTITEDDAAPAGTVEFSATSYSVAEDGTSVDITVSRVNGSAGAISVNYATSDDTATAGSDYTAASGTLTWADGNADNKTFTVSITNDTTYEGDEGITLTLSNAVGTTISSTNPVSLTITEDDAVPSAGTVEFNATSYSVAENGADVTITVSRVGGSYGAVSVDYATSNDTATAGSDYSAASGTLSWIDGNSDDKTFTVTITDDTTYEGDESVTLTLSNAVGTTISSSNPVTLTITEDDAAPVGTVEFSATSYTVAENGTDVTITVSRVGGSYGAISVDYATSDDTATAGNDYSAASGTLSWIDGNSDDKTFTVAITDDATCENNETVNLILSNIVGTTISATNPILLTINDNDTAGFTLSKDASTVAEGAGIDSFSVVLDAAPVSDVVISVTSSDTGEVTVDNASLTFTSADWDTVKFVTITAVDDAVVSNDSATITMAVVDGSSDDHFDALADQTVTVTCTDDAYALTVTDDGNGSTTPTGSTIVDPDAGLVAISATSDSGFTFANWTVTSGVATIADANSATTTVTATAACTVQANSTANGTAAIITSAPILIVNENSTNSFTAELSVQPVATVTVTVVISGDTDLTLTTPTTLTFTATDWDTPKVVTVAAAADSDAIDGVSTVFLTSADATDTTVAVTENDDETPGLTLSIGSATMSENGDTATATLTRNTDTTGALLVNLSSDDASEATVPATATIPAGQTSTTFAITAVDDADVDGTVTVTVTATAGGHADGTDSIDVSDDDVASLTVAITEVSISESGGTSTVTLTRNTDTTGALVVNLNSDKTGDATVPATATIAAGQASTTFTVTAVDNADVDGTQTVTLTATAAAHAAGMDTIDIIDDETPTLILTITSASIAEGGTSSVMITRNFGTSDALVVSLNSGDTGEATVPASVTIPAGDASATFTITGVADSMVDGTQTVIVTASATGFSDVTDTVDITNIDVATLTLSIGSASMSENGGTAIATLTRNTDTTGALVVNLSSDDTNEATVPATATISAGQASTTFTVTAVDDADVDGTVTVTVTAASAGHSDGTDSIDVSDDDVASLTVAITAASMSESGGTSTVTLTRNTDTTGALVVTLSSNDTSEATVPATAIISAGQASTQFDVTAVDDGVTDGTQAVTVTASAAAHADGTDTIDVLDDEVEYVTLSIDSVTIAEFPGAATVTATLQATAVADVTVNLELSGTATFGSDYALATQIVIPTGQSRASVTLTSVDDTLDEDDETVIIEIASITNALENGTQMVSCTITDDDEPAPPSGGGGGGGGGCSMGASTTSSLIPLFMVILTAGISRFRRRKN